MPKDIDVKDFARRVESLCEFLLNRAREEGELEDSNDIRVIHDLKEDAADLHYGESNVVTTKLKGLSDFMNRGTMPPEEN